MSKTITIESLFEAFKAGARSSDEAFKAILGKDLPVGALGWEDAYRLVIELEQSKKICVDDMGWYYVPVDQRKLETVGVKKWLAWYARFEGPSIAAEEFDLAEICLDRYGEDSLGWDEAHGGVWRAGDDAFCPDTPENRERIAKDYVTWLLEIYAEPDGSISKETRETDLDEENNRRGLDFSFHGLPDMRAMAEAELNRRLK